MFDNTMDGNKKISTDNMDGGDSVDLYECNFESMEERLCDSHLDIEQEVTTLGYFPCKLLSTDFEQIARSVQLLLSAHLRQGDLFPENELLEMLGDLFGEAAFQELGALVSVERNLYKLAADGGPIQEINYLYGDWDTAFTVEAYMRFKVCVVLQAYLEESENTPEMCNPNNFERFINGGIERRITRQDQAISLSEYDLLTDVLPGCNAKELVADVFSNLMKFNDSFIVIGMNSLDDFLISTVYYYFLNGFIFKRCKNCGQFFIPFSRTDEMYCNNASPQDKTRTCKEYGAQKLWYDRLKGDEAAKLSRNIYSAKQMLVRRNPDIQGYREMFEFFKAERKKWEVLVKTGEKTREEYIAWLNEMKSQKTLK